MLKEGSIFNKFMLTKLVTRTPLGELYQSIHVESGERYLIKLAGPEWHMVLDEAPLRGFEFSIGSARPWSPPPADLLSKETQFLQEHAHKQLALLRPLIHEEAEGIRYTAYNFFDGETLQSHIQGRSKFNTFVISTVLREVSKLHANRLFHGNLQPSTMLISEDRVVFLEPTMPYLEMPGASRKGPLRCVTSPGYYPFLDPRHDSLALGLLLYYFFTQRHPILSPLVVADEPLRRKTERRLQAFIDRARLRGASRYFTPLLSYVNPSQLRRRIDDATEQLINRTLGLHRRYTGEPDEEVAIVPGSWLALWVDPMSVSPDKIWTLDRAAEAFTAVVEARMRERAPSNVERAS